MRRYLLLVALVLTAVVMAGAVIYSSTQTSAPSRSWCDGDTWDGGNVPGAADQAVIVSEVIVDCDWTVGAVRIDEGGSLRWAGTAELTVDATAGGDATGRVEVLGELEMRPDVDERQVLSFAGIDAGAMVGGDAGMMTDPGGLHVIGAGELDLDGPDRTAWTRLTADVGVGSTVLDVHDADGWQIGDPLHITPTASGDLDGSYATIAAIDGTTITLDQPLTNDHPTVAGHTAEVLNLTRNVEIRGQNSYVTIHPSAGVQHLADVALVDLGPDDVLGRYPLHLHRQEDASRGSTFTRLLVLGGENRGIVPHGSHGTAWTDVVVHDVAGPGLWWDRAPSRPRGNEINSTHDTIITSMVVSATRTHSSTNGFRTTGYALNRGTGNVLTDSVAVGVGGTKDSSGFMWTEGEANGESGVWVFERNVAHNNARHGIFTWQNTSSENHIISDFVAYANGGWGVSHGAYRNRYRYVGLDLIGNTSGGLLIHSVSNGEPGQRFDSIHVADSPVGIATTRHQLSPLAPTRITDPSFSNVDEPFVAGGWKHPDVIELAGWAECPSFSEQAHPDSVWILLDTVEICSP